MLGSFLPQIAVAKITNLALILPQKTNQMFAQHVNREKPVSILGSTSGGVV